MTLYLKISPVASFATANSENRLVAQSHLNHCLLTPIACRLLELNGCIEEICRGIGKVGWAFDEDLSLPVHQVR